MTDVTEPAPSVTKSSTAPSPSKDRLRGMAGNQPPVATSTGAINGDQKPIPRTGR
jgi:hypothetical protein